MRYFMYVVVVWAALFAAMVPLQAAPEHVGYNRHVRPILSDRCFQCHGRDEGNRQADLRLDQREEAIASAIVPGNAEQSELIARLVTDDDSQRMPPLDSHKPPLTDSQITILRRWIDAGAHYEPHWAFIPPSRPKVPQPDPTSEWKAVETDWSLNPIDVFVYARMREEGLLPSPPTDRGALIRRVTLDLTGLPPTLSEVEAFMNDDSPSAYEDVVDRLLRSTRYGEHMARYWLDAARYADTNGFQYDLNRDQWPWRDWVIHAFNQNMPFDQFTVEQLAGDLLPNATEHQRLATAFNRNHPITIEGGVIDEEYRTEYVADRVVTTSTVWLGLTMLCARCHDHKYDPISQREFYELFAFFNNVPEKGINAFDPKEPLTSPLRNQALRRMKVQVDELNQKYRTSLTDGELAWSDWEQKLAGFATTCWQVVTPDSVTSKNGSEFKTLPDGSVLVVGPSPERDTYEIIVSTDLQQLQAVRLETLPDESLSRGGLGRAENGNFVLSEILLAAGPGGRLDQFNSLGIQQAEADYSQAKYDIAKIVDGNQETGGWAVDGHRLKEPRLAIFHLKKPAGFSNGTMLRIQLVQNHGTSHLVGRFRIALSAGQFGPPTLAVQHTMTLALEDRLDDQSHELQDELVRRYGSDDLRDMQREWVRLQAESAELENIPDTMIMSEMSSPRATHVLFRGEYDKPRDLVKASTPSVFPSMPEGVPSNRLGLAQWLVMPDHPLTARVTVNRLWQRLFGTGLVKTTEDFGTQGEWPSHPDLLDWLAVEFVESGWDVKALHKQIVTSATYRQSSATVRGASSQVTAAGDWTIPDAENRLLSRGPRLRLDAETIRDCALSVSGQLIDNIGGPSVFPYQPAGLWQEVNNRPGFSQVYRQDHGEGLYRRSLYTYWKRTVPPASMAIFDAPEREYCVVKRSRTNTPLQAFVLMHDPQYIEAARRLAERMILEGGATDRQRLVFGFRTCLARPPSPAEVALLEETLTTRRQQYAAEPEQANRLLSIGEAQLDRQLETTEHAAFTTVARMLLNLSEFISKS
ncbi:MAG: PSD1 and planctomycete cytochrome C domain-containing protein [Pirellulaceae bacterium]|nr:PSD1 and planctomycete cytochrome C domain-containing protein [Pirellulaceae bacterium]